MATEIELSIRKQFSDDNPKATAGEIDAFMAGFVAGLHSAIMNLENGFEQVVGKQDEG